MNRKTYKIVHGITSTTMLLSIIVVINSKYFEKEFLHGIHNK